MPYRIVLETIDMNDLNKFQPKYKKGDREKTVISNMTVDTFLDDIPSNNPHVIEIIK